MKWGPSQIATYLVRSTLKYYIQKLTLWYLKTGSTWYVQTREESHWQEMPGVQFHKGQILEPELKILWVSV